MAADPSQEVELSSGDKKLKLRGESIANLIVGILMAGGLVYLATTLHSHNSEAAVESAAAVSSTKELVTVMKDSVTEQKQTRRELACLLRVEQKDRSVVCSDLSK